MTLGLVQPNTYIALQLPSDQTQVIEIVPNTTISIGKYGSFQGNHIIGRPYHLTYELRDTTGSPAQSGLRIVSAAELYADIENDEISSPAEELDIRSCTTKDGTGIEIVGENGEVVLRTNRSIVDNPTTQTMTMAEIEEMKAQGTGSGKDLITKILDSHMALDQKTAYALAKYTLRKTKKFLRRFTVLPLDVPLMTSWILHDKEPMRTMELRQEVLAMVGSLSNVHYMPEPTVDDDADTSAGLGRGRWLVIDETAGLLVASIAEQLGILNPPAPERQPSGQALHRDAAETHDPLLAGVPDSKQSEQGQGPRIAKKLSTLANSNTITLLHANSQPNLSLLKYFGFEAGNPSLYHPLYRHLRSISWLQLLAPEEDLGYMEPETFPNEVVQTFKSGRKGNYYRKRRRWERIKKVVDETRGGGFDGLIIATVMEFPAVLQHTVPLLRGAAQVVIYSPTIEPLTELADLYSSGRRSAYLTNPPDPEAMPTEDFPLDPTLLLSTTIQTVRCRNWQVLPGRTHPLMTGRGGSEGYIFSATRVLPAEGKIEARGKFKRRKIKDQDGLGVFETRKHLPEDTSIT